MSSNLQNNIMMIESILCLAYVYVYIFSLRIYVDLANG